MSTAQQIMCTRENRKVCFIAGTGHSGSTLLGMVLGSHPDCFYAGEAGKTRYLHDTRKDPRKRMCKLCGPTCPVWSDFHVLDDPDLYEQISRKVARPVVIDSTKSTTWLREEIRAIEDTTARVYFLFLQRDGRAVLNSRVRKYPQKSPVDLIESWLEKMRETSALFEDLTCQKMIVHYEDLALYSSRTTRHICEFLHIDFQPEMLEFFLHEHHPLGGNNGTQLLVARHRGSNPEGPCHRIGDPSREHYERHVEGIEIDLRWKTELDPELARLFDRVAGPVNEPLRWEG